MIELNIKKYALFCINYITFDFFCQAYTGYFSDSAKWLIGQHFCILPSDIYHLEMKKWSDQRVKKGLE